MLYDAIAQSWVASRCCLLSSYAKNILSQSIKDEAWRLENKEFINGIVYKTHDLCPENVDKLKNVKILYVYGDPLDSALSVDKIIEKEGDIWLDEHLFHLKGKGVRNDLFKKDILNYKKQMTTWKNVKSNNVFIIRYDDIWNQVEEVSRFLGFKLNISDRRERVEKNILGLSINQQIFNELRSLYDSENL
ncbi:MAG: sulfotransferase domain-containing protein [Deltaproteobacteria bacterium]|nr:sulfotransferase domain-containing protein [Deltaproteobacteria bacterium]